KRSTMARPIPLAPPVTTATRSTRRLAYGGPSLMNPPASRAASRSSCGAVVLRIAGSFRADEYVLHVAERLERVRPELASDPRLLGTTEGRPVAHGRVRVDRQRPGLHRPGHPQGPADIACPQRAR